MVGRTIVLLLAGLTLVALGLRADPSAAADVERLSGTDRIGTAVALSQAAYPDGAPAAVLALAWNFPDALASAPLATASGGPVLLTHQDRLDARVEEELARLGAETVYLVGGTRALSDDVEASVSQLDGITAERVSGADRFSTAAEVAGRAVDLWRAQGHADAGEGVLVALGAHADPNRAWPDALASGALSGHARWPILLVTQAEVPQATQDALAELGASEAVIVGGTSAIPGSVAENLVDNGLATRRIGGSTRHHTSVLLADEAIAHGAQREITLLATGGAFPDGLAAGPAAHAGDGVVLLSAGATLPAAPHPTAWLADWREKINTLQLVGGPAALSEQVRQDAQALFGPTRLRAVEVASGLQSPVFAAQAPQDDRLLVLEQPGRVRAVHPDGGLTTFLDIRGRVGSGANEQGLLGLAFHPDYPSNRRLYLHYTNTSGNTVVSEFRAAADGATASPGSERVLFTAPQPFGNHNGGMLEFGADGHLYVALGDGGSGGDPQGNGQNPSTPLGALLRMTIDGDAPEDNPFVDGGGHPLVWAYGLRNPWRFAFDTVGERIFIADVGQAAREEVNVGVADASGVNYGWNMWEGTHCFEGPCVEEGMTFPVIEYETNVDGCAITGGYVYRGRAILSLTGQYLYADFCQGWVASFRFRDGEVVEESDWSADLGNLGQVSSFGQDAQGELYVVSHNQGRVYRIAPR